MKTLVDIAAAALASAAVILTAGQPAVARAQEAPASVRVSFADLDLRQPSGRTTLERRIHDAINRVCPTPFVGDTRAMSRHRACKEAAASGAQQQVAAIMIQRANPTWIADAR